jgi:hypothetical protein
MRVLTQGPQFLTFASDLERCHKRAGGAVIRNGGIAPFRVLVYGGGKRAAIDFEACEDGDRRACVRLGIIIGENRERRAAWRREHPEAFFYER